MKTLIAKENYFDVKVGDTLVATEFVEAAKGECSFYKTYVEGDESQKIHYMFTHEVEGE